MVARITKNIIVNWKIIKQWWQGSGHLFEFFDTRNKAMLFGTLKVK